ncbi:MAG TPA: glycosyltransferase family 4 protein [Solirubrobacterales bacterium]|nr:glycosyltransferase family 4 protein [Solirubrobacterales bacterium]
MKVGLVSPYDYTHPGGVTHHIRNLGDWLHKLGHEVRTFAPSSRRQAEYEIPNFYRIGRVFSVPANDSVARITLSFHLASRVKDILEKERFDVLHFHEPLMPALPITLLRLSRNAGIPTIGTFHAFAKSNLGYYYGRPLLKPYLQRLDEAIAVSPAAEDFVHHYFDIKLRIIPNGIDVDNFKPGLAPIRHLRDDRVNVLFVGRLEKRKGLRDLLQAYALMKERFSRARLIVVGDGPLRSSIEHHLAKHRLEDVVLAGYVPESVKPRYYATADIFCAPATGGESFGIVLLEAMASGVPVVCTEVPGYLTVVEPGVDSLTVRPGRPAELGQTLTVLARDRELRARLGAAALRKAQGYSWREITSQVIEVYQDARRSPRLAASRRSDVHDAIPEVG